MKHSAILLLSLLTLQTSVFGQTDKKIDQLIDQLSWRSVGMTCMGGVLLLTHDNDAEKALTKIGKPATEKLVKALSDKNKTVIAHIILTEIWDENAKHYFFGTQYMYKDCNQLIGWHNMYNGLIWEWYSGGGDSITSKEVDKIQQYWTRRVINKEKVSLDYASISRELDKSDSLLYPCNKVYNNNSADITSETLFQLMGKNSHDTAFKNLWNSLGNDSTTHHFDDCYFVTYGPEGLSFRFEKDSLLSIIFIEDSYQGELPYDLKIGDKRETIERKIGQPEDRFEAGDNCWSYYKEKRLSYYFDKNGKMLELYMSRPKEVLDSILLTSECKLDTGELGHIFSKLEIYAEFPGGFQKWVEFARKKFDFDYVLQYIPDSKNIFQDSVIVKFVVSRNGSICGIECKNGNTLLLEPVRRLLKSSPLWVPGLNGGRMLNSYRTLRVDVLIDKKQKLRKIVPIRDSYYRSN